MRPRRRSPNGRLFAFLLGFVAVRRACPLRSVYTMARYFTQTLRAPEARQAPRTTPPDIAPKIPSHTPIQRTARSPLGKRAPIPPILVRAKCPPRRERTSRIDLAHRRKNKWACGKPHEPAAAPLGERALDQSADRSLRVYRRTMGLCADRASTICEAVSRLQGTSGHRSSPCGVQASSGADMPCLTSP
jgi:hypothetical protein